MNSVRTIDDNAVIPVCEPADHEAGIEFDSFHAGRAAHWDVFVQFGAVTGDAVLSVYIGATAGAKTTKIPFRHRLSSGDFKAASADQFAASDTSDADGDLTLTAATYDHRVLAIMLDAQEIDDAKPWVTIDVSAAASALLMSAVAIGAKPRLQPAVTAIA
jgi:hypothetical protein